MKIFICGFMGAGKSFLLRKLPQILQGKCNFYDLDDLIFQNLKIAQDQHLGAMIERIGWPKFRKEEKKIIGEVCQKSENVCLALGGGALTQETVDMIKKSPTNLLVWVDTPIDVCIRRIRQDEIRPLGKKNDFELEQLYTERSVFYKQAHLRIGPEDDNFGELVGFVRKHVGSA